MTTIQLIGSKKVTGEKKKKRVSKKKKSSWRKHSSVKEIEEYFEAKRQQERVGTITAENVGDLFEDDKKLSAVKSQKNKKINLLDSHKSPFSRSQPTKQKKSSADPLKVVALSRKDLKKGRYKGGSGDDGEKNEDEDEGVPNQDHKKAYDVWSSKEKVGDLELYRRRICRIQPVKPPTRLQASTASAILNPHPGQSYNPSFHHHQSLLKEAVEREIGKGKRERKIINATDAMFPSKKDAPTQESWLNEMSEGLGGVVKIIGNNKTLKGAEKKMVKKKKKKMLEEEDDEEDEDEDEDDGEEKNHADDNQAGEKNDVEKVGGDDDDDEKEEEEEEEDNKRLQLSYNAPVRREDKKSEKTRRKMGERKEQADKHLRQKRLKKEMSQTFRVKSLRQQLRRQELQRASRLQHRLLLKEKMASAPKKLGKGRFVEPAPVLKLSNEIEGDLRRLKPESHPMKELVQSLQRRNITPTTPRGTAIKPRKYKPKVFEKKSHKMVSEQS